TVTDAANPQRTASATVSVNETRLVATLSAASVQAGVPLTLTVQAQDAAGNLVPGYAHTVAFTTTDAGLGLLPSCDLLHTCYNFGPADAGQHSFPVNFATAGPQTIT